MNSDVSSFLVGAVVSTSPPRDQGEWDAPQGPGPQAGHLRTRSPVPPFTKREDTPAAPIDRSESRVVMCLEVMPGAIYLDMVPFDPKTGTLLGASIGTSIFRVTYEDRWRELPRGERSLDRLVRMDMRLTLSGLTRSRHEFMRMLRGKIVRHRPGGIVILRPPVGPKRIALIGPPMGTGRLAICVISNITRIALGPQRSYRIPVHIQSKERWPDLEPFCWVAVA